MEKVECKLVDGESISGHLERVFRPIEGEVAISSEDKVHVLPFDRVSCVLFTSTSDEQNHFQVRGVQAEDIKTKGDDYVYNVRIVQQDLMEDLIQGFYGVPSNQENGPSYIFFPKAGIVSRSNSSNDKSTTGTKSTSKDKINNTKETKQQVKIGDILIDYNMATKDQIDVALKEQSLAVKKGDKKYLGEILIESKIITEKELLMALALKFRLKSVDLRDVTPYPETLDLVPAATVRKLKVFPISSDEKKITIATSQPADVATVDTLRFCTNRWVEMVIATHKQIDSYITKYYEDESSNDEINLEEAISEIELQEENQDISLKDEAGAAPVVRLANKILHNAVKEGASDIHLLPEEKGLKVSYRINGLLKEHLRLDKRICKSLVARFKIVAQMDISEHRLPQDGRFRMSLNKHQIEFRVSCMPGNYGENLVLRILNKSNDAVSLDKLGLDTRDMEAISHLVRSTHGMFLVTGPTGSGKSTTLASVLRSLVDEPRHMLSLEDPIEIEVPGINQIQIHEKIGFSFASALRNVLRHDPDVIMVGEIRDKDTAKIAVQAALTGHVLISTLHTNSAAAAFSRLSDMGVEPYLVSATVKGVMAQQLLPKLCKSCRLTRDPDDKILEFMAQHGIDTQDITDYYSTGCDHCHDTGISGRVLVYEFLNVNLELQKLVTKEAPLEIIQETACKLGMRPLVKMAIDASQKGLLSLEHTLPLFIE
ncbi:MAG: GspE/PulE family protein [Planctomycetota bacterium]